MACHARDAVGLIRSSGYDGTLCELPAGVHVASTRHFAAVRVCDAYVREAERHPDVKVVLHQDVGESRAETAMLRYNHAFLSREMEIARHA